MEDFIKDFINELDLPGMDEPESNLLFNLNSGELVWPNLNTNEVAAQQIDSINPNEMHYGTETPQYEILQVSTSANQNEVISSQPLEFNTVAQPIENLQIPAFSQPEQYEANMELKFIEMPQRTIRFRTKNDPNTHGVIKGENATSSASEVFPSIQFKVPVEKKDNKFYVVADCYIKSDLKSPILSPHLLGRKRARASRKANKNQKEPKYDIVQPLIEEIRGENGVFVYTFKDFFIISQSREASNEIHNKYASFQSLGLIREFDGDYINSKAVMQSIMQSNNVVCLGFSIYEKTINGYELCLGPVLSTPIYHANKSVQLTRVCNERGKVEGGNEITLLVTGITEKNVTVIIKEEIGNWSVEVSEFIEVHQKAAITFCLPPYGGGRKQEGDINCLIYLKRQDGVHSETSRFIYEKDQEPRRKNARSNQQSFEEVKHGRLFMKKTTKAKPCSYLTDSVEFKPASVANTAKDIFLAEEPKIIYPTHNIDKDIKVLKKLLDDSRSQNKNINHEILDNEEFVEKTIFDAMKYDKFLELCKIIEQYDLREFLYHLRNNDGDTLLHYACKLHKFRFIRYLIGMNFKLCTQNHKKQTPLHLAIESCDKRTIEEWIELLENLEEYHGFEDEFKRCLSLYDCQGFNVLHFAIIKDQTALVASIMKFYQNSEIDLSTYEVLGNGMGILHLAISKRLKNMTKLIIKIEPGSLYYEDYKGETAFDLIKKYVKKINVNLL